MGCSYCAYSFDAALIARRHALTSRIREEAEEEAEMERRRAEVEGRR